MMADAYILIFYMALITEGRIVGGGPATAEFADHRSCEEAAHEILHHESARDGFARTQWYICVAKEQGR